MSKRDPRAAKSIEVCRRFNRACDLDAEATIDADGCLRWNKSGNPVPYDLFAAVHGEHMSDAMFAAYDRAQAASLKRYRKARRNMSPEQKAEEAYERRAAFGPGVELVNVLTGERSRS